MISANRESTRDTYDVIIVGAGPAGLSAALILGRARRSVLVCDSGNPRNAASHALHGYLTRDGISPREFLALGRRELEPYETVSLRHIPAIDAERDQNGRFRVTLADGAVTHARKLLVATGVCDNLPDIPGFAELYGRSVFHCPYCDGWEVRDQPLALYGRGARRPGLSPEPTGRGRGLRRELPGGSRGLVLCTDGPCEIDEEGLARLERARITLRQERVVRL